MITKCVWNEFKENLNYNFYGMWSISDEDVAGLLLICILLTPLTCFMDIALMPLEVIYILTIKFIRKLRRTK